MSDADTKTEEEELAESKAAEEVERLAKIKADEEANLEEGEDAGTKTKEEEEAAAQAAEEAKKAGEKKVDTELSVEDKLHEEIAELKERHSTSDATVRALENKLTAVNEVLKEQGFVTEEDPDKQAQIIASETSRREYLSNLHEMMALSPKYPDLEEVVTTHNKQLVIEAYAANLVADDPSIDEATALAAVKETVAGLSNPHKFYYEQIKALEKAGGGETEEGKKAKAIKNKDPKMTDAPASVANMGAGSGDGGAWTASKLDNMSEELLALSDVPQAILDQWKAGTLPK